MVDPPMAMIHNTAGQDNSYHTPYLPTFNLQKVTQIDYDDSDGPLVGQQTNCLPKVNQLVFI